MAQTPQPDESGGVTPPANGESQGLFGNLTWVVVIGAVVAYFLWQRRRNAAMQERLLTQRREREETAQQSAMNVAHIMRRPASAEDAAAAASGGLAAAARMPADASLADEEQARVMERAEARAEAERAAEEQAIRAAEAADLAGASAERRAAAAEASAEEARADTADAMSATVVGDVFDSERDAMDALREGLHDLDTEVPVPLGAVAGDGSATCPPDYPVKGNGSSRLYHLPNQVSYPPTIAEFCFASAEAAEAAGFRQSRAREQRGQK